MARKLILDGRFGWWHVKDPASGCHVFMQEVADGRLVIQFDDNTEPLFLYPQELLTLYPGGDHSMEWVSHELLREHLREHPNTAHVDESYVELAAR